MPTLAPYGSWQSPITSQVVTAKSIGLGGAAIDGNDIYWLEVRPEEKGRGVIVRRTPDGALSDVNPPPFNARNMAHEYGGGDFCVADGVVYFSNFSDQRIYTCFPGESPRPLTPEGPYRYADAIFDPARRRLLCIREDHTVDEPARVVNTLVSVDVETGQTRLLAVGSDFYASPRLSPDGAHLCWLEWDHPNMPWDGTRLMLAPVQPDGSLGPARQIAGGQQESVFQPAWSPGGTLHFITDPHGWWNPYRIVDGKNEAVRRMEAEFGLPQWVFGMFTYDFEDDETLIAAYAQSGAWRLARLHTPDGALTDFDLPYTAISGVRTGAGFALFQAGSPTQANALIRLDLSSGAVETLRSTLNTAVDARYISVPESIAFPTENGLIAHGYFYPPANPDYAAPAGEKPPLVVFIHGGPTGAASATLRYGVQYWTSRGIAVLDVNYSGSTGFGRAYRERLKGQWGVVDMDDCVNGAKYLATQGRVDGNRMAIRGGSAGGYTTLAALAFRNVFRAGASHFGVSDIEALAMDTHKFESRYMDSLVGPYPAAKAVYKARSPIHHVHKINAPLILFQGLDDKIVPPNQSERIYTALLAREVPVAYIAFEGEGHGFRQAANIQRALEAELYFYGKVFGFDLANPVEPVQIENL